MSNYTMLRESFRNITEQEVTSELLLPFQNESCYTNEFLFHVVVLQIKLISI